MNKLYLFAFLFMLASCSSSYQFVQVQEYSAGNSNTLTVENDDVSITYSVEHLVNGWCSYTVYNKTDGFVYVDKSKSFTIDQSGFAHNVISPDEHSAISEKKQTVGMANQNDSADYTVYTSSEIIVIPPKAKKTVYGRANGFGLILHCDLPQYPSDAVSVNIGDVVFRVVTTYKVDGKQSETTVTSAVTLDKVSNMPEYLIARYRQRPQICENKKEAGKIYPPDDDPVYDIYYETVESAITFPYYVINSSTKYFDHKPEYGWFPSVNGYKRIR